MRYRRFKTPYRIGDARLAVYAVGTVKRDFAPDGIRASVGR